MNCRNGHEQNELNTYTYPKTGRKSCRVCHKNTERQRIQSPEKAQENRDRVRRWATENPERYRLGQQRSRQKYKKAVDDMKTACSCGETHKACLDFHHIKPSTKLFDIGKMFGKVSLSRMLAEIAKCNILCSNCHRKLHAQERQQEGI